MYKIHIFYISSLFLSFYLFICLSGSGMTGSCGNFTCNTLRNSRPFSIVAVPFDSPTSSVWSLHSLHIFVSTCYCLSFKLYFIFTFRRSGIVSSFGYSTLSVFPYPILWWRLPWWLTGKESTCSAGHGSLIPGKRKWQPTTVFLPGKSHGPRSLEGYSPWGCKGLTQLSD